MHIKSWRKSAMVNGHTGLPTNLEHQSCNTRKWPSDKDT